MDVVFLIGRILFGTIFFLTGVAHFAAKERMAGYAKSNGSPSPEVLVPLTGAALILGAVSIALGIFPDVGALVLIVFLSAMTFLMHAFWKIADSEEQQQEMIQFNKNASLLGAAIVLFWLFNQGQDLPLTLTDSLFEPF